MDFETLWEIMSEREKDEFVQMFLADLFKRISRVVFETTIKGHCETCALYNSLGCPYAPDGGNGRCDEWRPE